MSLSSGTLAALLLLSPALGYKVLFFPVPGNSHLVLLSTAAQAWVKAGHEAHVVKHHSVPVPTQYNDSGIHYVNHGKKGEVHFMYTKDFVKQVGTMSGKGPLDWAKWVITILGKTCDSLLRDEELFIKLQKENYDLAVVNHYPSTPACLHAIAYRLGIPYVSLGLMAPFDMVSHTLQSSFLIPIMHQSEEPCFSQRLAQFVSIHALQAAMRFYIDDTKLIEYLKDTPVDDVHEVTKKSKVYLIDWEPLLDAPVQAAPNMVHIGGISASEVKPLPADLKIFADSAKEGLVVVSFGGSLTTNFPDEMQRKLLAGLGMLKYKVVIRLEVNPDYEIGSNILITRWLPQNDLLGHPNTVLFITHCGLNSVRQGVHHGVRMLGFPNQEEQKTNAKRVRDRNYGFFMDRNNFTSKELKANVDKVMADERIETALRRAVDIIKSRKMTGAQEVVYWIEHVIRFGGDHLVPYTSKLAWYEVMMYDILLAILLIFLVVLFVAMKFCRCVKLCCCGKVEPKKKTS